MTRDRSDYRMLVLFKTPSRLSVTSTYDRLLMDHLPHMHGVVFLTADDFAFHTNDGVDDADRRFNGFHWGNWFTPRQAQELLQELAIRLQAEAEGEGSNE